MLVELMGGKIWLESPNPAYAWSKTNPGSVFHFVLPFKTDTNAPYTYKYKGSLSGLNTLVINNHQTNIKLIGENLSVWGMNLSVARNTEEAIDLMTQDRNYHLIIADNNLLRDKDNTFIKEAREIIPALKALLLVANPKTITPYNYKGFDKILHKPVKYSQLFMAISELFNIQDEKKSDIVQNSEEDGIEKNGVKKRILLVEDNPINQKIAEKMLLRLNYEVVIAPNGQEALNILSEGKDKFNLILMDVQMPVLNGLDATKELRAKGVFLPVIAMTANVLKGDREICLEAGMNDYIGKPVRIETLETTLSRWLKTS